MLGTLQGHDNLLRDPLSASSDQPDEARNTHRSLQPRYFVAIAQGTDLNCPIELFSGELVPRKSVSARSNAGEDPLTTLPGFRDQCRGSHYDIAGRVYSKQEAQRNLVVPPHRIEGAQLIIGP
jgi:ubiquinol-cytochrome c reductase iron-sulfur subunit